MRRAFVHRYKYSHDARRAQLRKAARRGTVRVVETYANGWVYEVPADFPLLNTRGHKS